MKRILIAFICLTLICLCSCSGTETLDSSTPSTTSKFNSKAKVDSKAQSTEIATNSTVISNTPTTTSKPNITSKITPDSSKADKTSSFDIMSLPLWKRKYINYINVKKSEYTKFALIHIDNDEIPELYMGADIEATGDAVCTVKNNTIVTKILSRCGGGTYIPKSGLLKNTNGNMGYYRTNIYKLDNSFAEIFYAEQIESSYDESTMAFSYKYFIGKTQYIDNEIVGNEVSEEEFENSINYVFDTSKSLPLGKNEVTYNQIINQIINW